MDRILPLNKSEEAKQWCELWDKATHIEKEELCEASGVTFGHGRNYRSTCGIPAAKPPQPNIDKLPFAKLFLDGKRHTPKVKSPTWEEHLEIIKGMDALVAYHHQPPSEIVIEVETELPIAVPFTADWHLGMPGCDYGSFGRDIDTIRDELGLYAFIGGDAFQNIIQSQKIGAGLQQVPVSVQRGLYVLSLKRIIDSILCIGTGNHNYWSVLAVGEDWDAELAKRLKLVYTKHAAIVHLKVGQQVYTILRLHKGRFNSSFNLTHSCKQYQRMYCPDARIVVVEHQHVAAMEEAQYNGRECIYIRPGTYGVYDDYAQQNGFFGAHVCNPTVILYPHEDRLVGIKDMHEAIIYLRAARASYEKQGQLAIS